MLCLLSPSKTQTTDVAVQGSYTTPLFATQAGQLVRQLSKFSEPELCELMKMSPRLAVSTSQRLRNFSLPHTPRNSSQALFMFQGDQFKPLDVYHYSQKQRDHAQSHLVILSGLYGIIRPLDLMQPYRLEMATKLAVEENKNLYEFWGERVTERVNSQLDNDPYPLLVNLASAEYFKVIRKKMLKAPVLTLSFKQNKGGQLKTFAVYAKRARGAMLNFIISNKITDPAELRNFTADGYSFAQDLSRDNEWVFVCTLT